MAEQLEFDFTRYYNVTTDTYRPVNRHDLAVYQVTYGAYLKVRSAVAMNYSYAHLLSELSRIHKEMHSDLKDRLNEPT